MKKVYIALFFLSITVQIFHAATFDYHFTEVVTQENGKDLMVVRPYYFNNATMCNIFLKKTPLDYDKDAVLTIPETIIQALKTVPKTASLRLAIIDLTGDLQTKIINISELQKAFNFTKIMTKGDKIKIQNLKASEKFKPERVDIFYKQ